VVTTEQPLAPHKFQITANARILRKSDEYGYVGAVHETYGTKDGQDAPQRVRRGSRAVS